MKNSLLYTDEDMPLLMIVFTSVMLLFISGISYPLELMPWYWKIAHFLIPASPGTLAYIKLNCMGADMHEIKVEYIILRVQVVVYFIMAMVVYRYNIKRMQKRLSS